MFNWAFNLNTAHNGYKTYQVHPSARQGMVVHCVQSLNAFSVSSGWWHCSSSWSALVPAPILKMFLVQRSWHGHPHSRWCGFQQFGRESMGNAWCLWYSSVVHLHPPTCSGWLRWIDHRSTPMTPMMIIVFGYSYGVLQDSFFVYVRQLFKFARLPLACIRHHYVSWKFFAYSNITVSQYASQTSFIRQVQLSSIHKDVLEHVDY